MIPSSDSTPTLPELTKTYLINLIPEDSILPHSIFEISQKYRSHITDQLTNSLKFQSHLLFSFNKLIKNVKIVNHQLSESTSLNKQSSSILVDEVAIINEQLGLTLDRLENILNQIQGDFGNYPFLNEIKNIRSSELAIQSDWEESFEQISHITQEDEYDLKQESEIQELQNISSLKDIEPISAHIRDISMMTMDGSAEEDSTRDIINENHKEIYLSEQVKEIENGKQLHKQTEIDHQEKKIIRQEEEMQDQHSTLERCGSREIESEELFGIVVNNKQLKEDLVQEPKYITENSCMELGSIQHVSSRILDSSVMEQDSKQDKNSKSDSKYNQKIGMEDPIEQVVIQNQKSAVYELADEEESRGLKNYEVTSNSTNNLVTEDQDVTLDTDTKILDLPDLKAIADEITGSTKLVDSTLLYEQQNNIKLLSTKVETDLALESQDHQELGLKKEEGEKEKDYDENEEKKEEDGHSFDPNIKALGNISNNQSFAQSKTANYNDYYNTNSLSRKSILRQSSASPTPTAGSPRTMNSDALKFLPTDSLNHITKPPITISCLKKPSISPAVVTTSNITATGTYSSPSSSKICTARKNNDISDLFKTLSEESLNHSISRVGKS